MGADYFMNPPVREKAKERASEAIKKLANDTWRDVNGCLRISNGIGHIVGQYPAEGE